MSATELPTPPVDLSRFNNPLAAFLHAIKHITTQGRACRKEYWMAVLGNVIVSFILGFILGLVEVLSGTACEEGLLALIINLVYSLLCFAAFLTLGIRRLHDTGRSGWWVLLGIIPIVGSIVLLVFFCLDSEPGENAYGANPKGC